MRDPLGELLLEGRGRGLDAGSHTRSARGVSGVMPACMYRGGHTHDTQTWARLDACVSELDNHPDSRPFRQHFMMFRVSRSVARRCKQHFMIFPVTCSVAPRCKQHLMMFPVSCSVAPRCKQHFMMFPVPCNAAARRAEHIMMFPVSRILQHFSRAQK